MNATMAPTNAPRLMAIASAKRCSGFQFSGLVLAFVCRGFFTNIHIDLTGYCPQMFPVKIMPSCSFRHHGSVYGFNDVVVWRPAFVVEPIDVFREFTSKRHM